MAYKYFRKTWNWKTKRAYRRQKGYWRELQSGMYAYDTRDGSKHPHKKGEKLSNADKSYRLGYVQAYKTVRAVKGVPYKAYNEGNRAGFRNGKRRSYRFYRRW